MITPESLAKSGSEDAHQKALFCWCSQNLDKYPQLKWLFHIPNGGSRHIAEAGKLKAMGVKRGVPDLFLPVPIQYPYEEATYHGLFIELKATKGGKLSVEQSEWISQLSKARYRAEICYGWEAARDCLVRYLE